MMEPPQSLSRRDQEQEPGQAAEEIIERPIEFQDQMVHGPHPSQHEEMLMHNA